MEISTLLLSILTLCISVYYFILRKMKYFERLKIPHLRPVALLGNMAPFVLHRLAIVDLIRKLYNQFSEAKYFGFYNFMTPVIVIRDVELINSIAIKNFDYFCDHNNFVNPKLDPMISRNIFGMNGDEWREMRKILSPSFTSSKMKMMFGLISECAENFADSVAAQSKDGKTYDMNDIVRRYANDVIATCAFGIQVDSFKDPNNDFLRFGKETMTFKSKTMKFLIYKNFPLLSRLLKIRLFSSKVNNFFKNVVSSTIKIRKENGIVRPDMIQLLMENLRKDGEIDIDEMTAQAIIFFIGGFDNISNSLCFLAHEIGVNPDIQSKLQEEIDEVLRLTNGKPTYEDINDMKYLDAVVNETLRLYPLGAFIDRKCVKEFELPPATPDAEPIMLKPGDTIWFPNYSIHLDPQYFPAPHKFDPDRFLEDRVDNSAAYMPFGIGPRICIANRFSLMETKIMLFYFLSRCDLEPSYKTTVPMVLDKSSLMMVAEGGFWLKLRARKLTVFDKK